MNCCANCFDDSSLKNWIKTISIDVGNCDFCDSKEVAILPCVYLSEMFDELFDLYENSPNAEWSLERKEPTLLDKHLALYWHKLFNLQLLKPKDIKQLVNQIGRGSAFYLEELFEEPVEYAYQSWTPDVPTDDLRLRWDNFAKEIKEKNRFFLSEVIDMDMLDSVFERLAITYPSGTEFYRARVHEEKLSLNELGKPPAYKTLPGRANPVGIPYLYVSESEKTTLYETRIALHESLTIGKFVTNEPISVVSLKSVLDFGPFEIMDRGFDLVDFIQFRTYLIKLGDELSKPVRKQDVNLDYLPTQYLCEYIKSKLGFDAVEYKSSMNPQGYNLAIFNDHKLECMSANHYKVKDIIYKWE